MRSSPAARPDISGGEAALADLVLARTGEVIAGLFAGGRTAVGAVGAGSARVGIADGPFAASLAARSADPIRIVEPGRSPEFLAPMPVAVLERAEAAAGSGPDGASGSAKGSGPTDRSELTGVLERLGLHTLGAFAALKTADVLARFGNGGVSAHRLARGLDERSPQGRLPPPDWSVAGEIDPPADRIDRVAFCARSLAEELHQRLRSEGVECVRVAIEAETVHGESMVRVWRHDGSLSAALTADRVRWQLDGWLSGRAGASTDRPTGGIVRVVLAPQEVVAAGGCQLDFWGVENETDRRAARVAARLQGQLGAEAVLVPVYGGGRHHNEQLRLVPSAEVELLGRSLTAADTPQAVGADGASPWPGSLPAPSPARVLSTPHAMELLDAHGSAVAVGGRGLLSSAPHLLTVDGRSCEVVGWAGPWPVYERWWDPERRCRQARFQILTDDGLARLVALESGQWSVVAIWD